MPSQRLLISPSRFETTQKRLREAFAHSWISVLKSSEAGRNSTRRFDNGEHGSSQRERWLSGDRR